MEKDYYLLGCTAIEDQLQDNVAQTINDFIKIGIKVWVLTGDKIDSAVSIAYSCKLLTKDFIIFEFKEKNTIEEISVAICEFNSIIDLESKRKFGLIIGTDELRLIFSNEELTENVND